MLNRLRREWPAWLRQVPAYGIGGVAAFWLIERTAGFWGSSSQGLAWVTGS